MLATSSSRPRPLEGYVPVLISLMEEQGTKIIPAQKKEFML